jgi:putative transposase
MIDKNHPTLSVSKQCNLLSLHRNHLYYQASEESQENLEILAFLDKQYYETPFYGVRKLWKLLVKKGYAINKKRVKRLMNLLNWKTIYRAPNTSVPDKEHRIYPYLLRNYTTTKPNEVWSTDITYIAMKRGFMYLCAIIDVHTRYVVNWSISNTMTADWTQQVMEEAIDKNGKPKIVNTDQGSQFTSNIFTQYLLDNNVQVSMDGKGRAVDNIWIERLWRTVKYEDIYLKSYSTVNDLNDGLTKYFKFYNNERLHETLNYETPKERYEKAA